MTGVFFMISTAFSRNVSDAQMASRDQNHQMIDIARPPGICFHNCLGNSVLAYTQGKKKNLSKSQMKLLCPSGERTEAFGPGN